MHTVILHVLHFIDDSCYVLVLFKELAMDQIPLTIPDHKFHRKSQWGTCLNKMERSVHSQNGSEQANMPRHIVDEQS
jgi:hypothetical protein